jgi:hypothetical protein
MTPMLKAALEQARQGVPVFPVDPVNKQPLCSRGFKAATTDGLQIRAWWIRCPNAMIGMPTRDHAARPGYSMSMLILSGALMAAPPWRASRRIMEHFPRR